jgi:hypothetical protein
VDVVGRHNATGELVRSAVEVELYVRDPTPSSKARGELAGQWEAELPLILV